MVMIEDESRLVRKQ
jgi:hypothetical protein